VAADFSAHGPIELSRGDDDIGAESQGELTLVGVTRSDHDANVGDVTAQTGDCSETHCSRTEHSNHWICATLHDWSGEQCGVDSTSEWLDEHGSFVGKVVDWQV
jgi:hypothetical protein